LQYWLTLLESVNVPVGPINNLEQVYQNPQVQARQMKISLPHPIAGQADFVASPLRLSASPVQYHSAPPLLGEHTEQVLQDILGLDLDQFRRCRDSSNFIETEEFFMSTQPSFHWEDPLYLMLS